MYSALIALLTAFILDIFVGDPPNRLHPVVFMGKLIHLMTGVFNHGNPVWRFIGGLFLIVTGGLLFTLPWIFVEKAIIDLPFWLTGILTGVLLKPVFAFRRLLEAGRSVQTALQHGDIDEARRLVSWHLVSRETTDLSAGYVASATIESLAENLTDSFFAPLFYFALGGLPLAWFYRFVNTADAMVGYHNESFEYFGKPTARLDDGLNWLPARIAGLLLVFSARLGRLNSGMAWRVMVSQHGHTASPNAGWTMAATAGALGLVLEKKDCYRLTGGEKLPGADDISKTIRLVAIALLLSLIINGGVLFERSLFF